MSENVLSEYSIVVCEVNNTPYDKQMDLSAALRRNNLRLKFMGNIHGPVYTGLPIQGQRWTLKVALIDVVTREVVRSCPEASAKLELVVLDNTFNFTDEEEWSCEDFNTKILGGADGKNSLLGGDTYVNLEDGVGFVNGVYFKHTRRWLRKLKCCLGARMVDHFNGTRIKEAKTEAFLVRDRRGIIKKHKPLDLTDKVWRLKRIGKNGPLHNRLLQENILTVKDFLTKFYLDRERLQQILEASKSGRKWEDTINHALTCKFDETGYLYFSSLVQKDGVVFNDVGELMGLYRQGQNMPVKEISASEKDHGCKLVASAFQHQNDIKTFRDHNSFMDYLSIPGNAINPSEPEKVDGSNGWNSDTSVMNVILGTEFSTSSQVAIPHNHSMSNASTSDDYSLDTIGNSDHISGQSLSFMGNFPTSPGYASEYSAWIPFH